ncbi:hypothetical protein D3C87_1794500 [compost metagenome]
MPLPGLHFGFARLRPACGKSLITAPHAGAHDTWAKGVNRDAFAGNFLGKGVGKTDHGELGGAVVGEVRETDFAGNRGQVDDAAELVLAHQLEFGLAAQEDATRIDIHDAVPLADR